MSKPSLLIAPGSYNVQVAPVIPCVAASHEIVIPAYTNVISGTPEVGHVLGHWTATTTCTDATGATVVANTAGNISLLSLGQGAYPGFDSGYQDTACPIMQKIVLTFCAGFPCDNSTPNMFATFLPTQWTTADSGFTAATSASQVLGSGVEVPIRCNIDNSGADIIAVTQNVVASIVNWVPCMVIPVAWDRAGSIATAWNSGPIAELTGAYKNAVPSGIACGAVGSIPFYGQTIAFDTCGADFAPGWVKTVLSYVIILGVGALVVRRIMWAVGSKA